MKCQTSLSKFRKRKVGGDKNLSVPRRPTNPADKPIVGPMDLHIVTQGAAWVFWPFCLELPEYVRSLVSSKQMLEEEQSHRELWFFLVIVALLTTGMVYFLGMP